MKQASRVPLARPHPPVRRGFTLVELLVVIGIIALLISILLPALTKARKSANVTKCLSNMKQFMTMTLMYTNDNKGWLPYSNWGDGPKFPKAGANPRAVDGALVGSAGWAYDGAIAYARGFYAPDDVKNSLLWPYAGNSVSVWRCPEDAGPWANNQSISTMTTYTCNGCISGISTTGDPYVVPRKITQFVQGAECLMYWEVSSQVGSGGAGWDGANYPYEALTVRHPGKSTACGFLDGHALTYSVDKFVNELNYGPSTLWCLPNHPTGGWGGTTYISGPPPGGTGIIVAQEN